MKVQNLTKPIVVKIKQPINPYLPEIQISYTHLLKVVNVVNVPGDNESSVFIEINNKTEVRFCLFAHVPCLCAHVLAVLMVTKIVLAIIINFLSFLIVFISNRVPPCNVRMARRRRRMHRSFYETSLSTLKKVTNLQDNSPDIFNLTTSAISNHFLQCHARHIPSDIFS